LEDIIGSGLRIRLLLVLLEFRAFVPVVVVKRATERFTILAATFVFLLIFSFAIFLRSVSVNLIRALLDLPGR
jgi:hypothetical protein